MSTDLSIVIPMHNGADVIETQLDSLAESLRPIRRAEIIVVDNRSLDGSPDQVRRWAETHDVALTVIEAHDKPGEPYARNVGWRAASSAAVAFCDADDAVGQDWASAMGSGLGKHAYLTGPLDTKSLNHPAIADMRGQSLFRSVAHLQSGIPYAHGCNMGFQKSALEELGGFDESFLIGCDIEIAVRAHERGIHLAWNPQALVRYRLRSTPPAVYEQARAYGRARRRIDAAVGDGASSFSWGHQLRRGAWLARHAPLLATYGGRMKWAWVAGQVAGELEGRFRS